MAHQIKQLLLTVLSPAIAACAVILLVGARHKDPLWLLPTEVILTGLGFATAFVIGLLLIRSSLWRTDRFLLRLVRVGVVGVVVSWPLVIVVWLTAAPIPRSAMIYELAMLFGLLFAYELLKNTGRPRMIALAVSLSAFLFAGLTNIPESREVELGETVDYVFSSLTDLKVTTHTVLEGQQEVNKGGGGIASINEQQLLLVTSIGEMYLASIQGETIGLEAIKVSSPLNRHEYLNDARVSSEFFRVTDVLVEADQSNAIRVFVSHHHWNTELRCLTQQMSEITLNLDSLAAEGQWVKRYETTPCLSLPDDFIPNTTGGRLSFLSPSSILMTVGIHRYDLIHNFDIDASDETVSYGKIVKIDLENWKTSVYSTGHRNPQGLLVDKGKVWSTEHGPKGGDELNVIALGGNYGWPDSSYGTKYGNKTGYTSLPAGTHQIGRRPIYAWVPSIGVSNLISISGTLFPGWKDDLIVSSLTAGASGRSLFRLRVRQDRVVFAEKLNIGQPVRDLAEIADGRIILWNGRDKLQVIAPANHVISACIGCHAPIPGSEHGIGPNLSNVVGRRVAAFEDFGYSDAMIAFGGRWTRRRLDSFLRNPGAAVPGTSMDVAGIQDEAQRQAIIEYLAEF